MHLASFQGCLGAHCCRLILAERGWSSHDCFRPIMAANDPSGHKRACRLTMANRFQKTASIPGESLHGSSICSAYGINCGACWRSSSSAVGSAPNTVGVCGWNAIETANANFEWQPSHCGVSRGNTVIWVLKVPDAMMNGSSEQAGRSFVRGMCGSDFGAQFFGAGYSIRVDAKSANSPVRRGQVITACSQAL